MVETFTWLCSHHNGRCTAINLLIIAISSITALSDYWRALTTEFYSWTSQQRQAVLLDGEPLEDVDNFKHLGLMFITSGQDTEEIKNRINLARAAFSLVCNPVFGRGVKYCCAQRAGSTRHDERHGLYE